MARIDENTFFWYSMDMIKGRTPSIHTEHIRSFANKLVTSANNKYGNRAISNKKFQEIMEHAPVQYASKLRGGQKNLSTYQAKKFLGGFIKHIQEHPEYKVSTYARKALNVKLHQGDNLIQGFNEKHIGEKALGAVAEIQQDADAAKNTGRTPEEQIRAKRVERARRGMNLYNVQKERADLESGKRTFTPTSITTGQEQKSKIAAISHEGAGTIVGASRTAGTDTKPTTAIPGQHAAAPVAAPTPVHLAGGGIGIRRADDTPERSYNSMPTIVGASDARGSAPSNSSFDEEPSTEKTVPTPGLKTEVTDIRPAKDTDDELPSTEDIDKNLPLVA